MPDFERRIFGCVGLAGLLSDARTKPSLAGNTSMRGPYVFFDRSAFSIRDSGHDWPRPRSADGLRYCERELPRVFGEKLCRRLFAKRVISAS